MTVSLADIQHSSQTIGVRAHYDAAQTTRENAEHWSFSSAMSANRINSRHVRSTLRNRARYELANNSYAFGIVRFIADEVVGQDLRLRIHPDEASKDDIRWLEGEIHDWLEAIDAVDKLQAMTFARVGDGESFGVMTSNPEMGTPVTADLRTYECDYVQLPSWAEMFLDQLNVDGVRLDPKSKAPVSYQFLRYHPGDTYGALLNDVEVVPADRVIHLYRPMRPGQMRGVSELSQSLPLFAQLRRWTLAVIAAAEFAADVAGVITSNLDDAGGGDRDKATPFERIEIERRALMTMPEGHDIRQFKAEQPQSTYADCKREFVAEMARSLCVPVGIALGDHSGFNYSSAKLDGQLWHKSRKAQRRQLRQKALNTLLRHWHHEAMLIPGYLPPALRKPAVWSHEWLFEGDEFADPIKEANGQAVRLKSGTTNLAIECARTGHDWEEILEQRAREVARAAELGLCEGEGECD